MEFPPGGKSLPQGRTQLRMALEKPHETEEVSNGTRVVATYKLGVYKQRPVVTFIVHVEHPFIPILPSKRMLRVVTNNVPKILQVPHFQRLQILRQNDDGADFVVTHFGDELGESPHPGEIGMS
jgi:hypothetical protein